MSPPIPHPSKVTPLATPAQTARSASCSGASIDFRTKGMTMNSA